MKISVNREECIGCGLCASLSPTVFAMDDDQKSNVIKTENYTLEEMKLIKEATEKCPAMAITLTK